MRNIDTNARYDKDLNNWVRQEADFFIIGLTDFGQEFVGTISSISELPTVGQTVEKGALYCVLESDKATSENYLPIGGIVVAVNETLLSTPTLINEDCYEAGWIVKLKAVSISDWDALKTAAFYESAIRSFFNK